MDRYCLNSYGRNYKKSLQTLVDEGLTEDITLKTLAERASMDVKEVKSCLIQYSICTLIHTMNQEEELKEEELKEDDVDFEKDVYSIAESVKDVIAKSDVPLKAKTICSLLQVKVSKQEMNKILYRYNGKDGYWRKTDEFTWITLKVE